MNQIRDDLVAGVVLKGLLPTRDEDKLGFGYSRVTSAPEFRSLMSNSGTPIADHEDAFEITYRMELMTGIAIQPDFQYVMTPIPTQGQTPSMPSNATVGGVRVEVSL